MKTKKNVLVAAAHPDDEVLGCGGTIAKHIEAGDDVFLIVFTDGVTSREYKPGISESRLKKICSKKIKVRRSEFNNAAKILGIKEKNISFYDLPDNRMDSVPLLDIIKKTELIASKTNFDIVYTHHWGDINIDHRKCLEAVLTVFRPKKSNAEIFCFEIPGNMNILEPKVVNEFCPDTFIDISLQLNTKLKALKAYKSELRGKMLEAKDIEAFCFLETKK